LSLYDLGQTGGAETVALLESEIPSHGHALRPLNEGAVANTATQNYVARPFGRGNNLYTAATSPQVPMNAMMLAPAGGDQPHNNMMPYLTFYFCIALQGVFPPRT
jgi:microcystin-dependent protein